MRLQDSADIVRKERLCAFALLGGVGLFTIFDVFEDLQEGSTPTHVVSEVFVIGLCVIACVYLWRRVGGAWRNANASIQEELSAISEDAKRWREAHSALSKGFSDAIQAQLNEWGLSAAEQEIAFLLMKGLSFKEIAQIRSTSEHTVRQQAAAVYRKSGVEGRSQLSAFFLEDLLTLGGTERRIS